MFISICRKFDIEISIAFKVGQRNITLLDVKVLGLFKYKHIKMLKTRLNVIFQLILLFQLDVNDISDIKYVIFFKRKINSTVYLIQTPYR